MSNILMINGVVFKGDGLIHRCSLAYPVVDDGSFANAAWDLIPLQMTLLHYLQREIITNHLLSVEPDWPWAKQPTKQ